MKSINDIINTLTPEERELHKELIEECIEREKSLLNIDKILQNNIEKLMQLYANIFSDINKLYKLSSELETNCSKTKNNNITNLMFETSSDKVFH